MTGIRVGGEWQRRPRQDASPPPCRRAHDTTDTARKPPYRWWATRSRVKSSGLPQRWWATRSRAQSGESKHGRVREEPRAHRERSCPRQPGLLVEPRPDAGHLRERAARRSSTTCHPAAPHKERAGPPGAWPAWNRGSRGDAPRFHPRAGQARRRVPSPSFREGTEPVVGRHDEPARRDCLPCRSSPSRRPHT
jgi:hypothetical protein